MDCPNCGRPMPRLVAGPRAPWPTRHRFRLIMAAHRTGACVAPVTRDPYAAAWDRTR